MEKNQYLAIRFLELFLVSDNLTYNDLLNSPPFVGNADNLRRLSKILIRLLDLSIVKTISAVPDQSYQLTSHGLKMLEVILHSGSPDNKISFDEFWTQFKKGLPETVQDQDDSDLNTFERDRIVNLLSEDKKNPLEPKTGNIQTVTKTFICYSKSDSAFALKLAQDLREKGFDVWMDQLDISPGQRWAREVDRALHTCENFLVILSPQSIESDNVDDEISVAKEEKKRIIPIMISPCKTPLQLRALQYIDFTTDYDSGFKRLTRTLEGLKAGRSS